MNIKALQDYLNYCKEVGVEPTWEELISFYKANLKKYKIA